MKNHCIYLLSPARCGGKRAAMLLNDRARFELALRLRTPAGAPLWEAFTFMSGLYFRGKYQYARRFARPPENDPGALVITPGMGLVPAERSITIDDLNAMAEVTVDVTNPHYTDPFIRDVRRLARRLQKGDRVVLLGSVASGKYVDLLLDLLGEKLYFPEEFIGRGDMSRGGLMLRCVEHDCPMTYIPAAGARRRGKRPPRLDKRSWVGKY